MSWAIDQPWASDNNGGSGNSIPFTYGGAVAAGSLLICAVIWSNATTITSVDDSVNGAGSWVHLTDTGIPVDAIGGAAGSHLDVWAFYNSAAGTPTITVNFSGSSATRSVVFASYTGIATATAFDQGHGNAQDDPGTGADAVTSGATDATAQANDLAIGVSAQTTGATYTALTSGWTSRFNADVGTNYKVAVEDFNITTATTVTATFTTSSAGADPMTLVVTLKEPTAVGRFFLLGRH